MTLRATITERQVRLTARQRRALQDRAEKRADEIASVHEVESDYTKVDRAGDLAIETKFQELYQLVDTEEERRAVADAFAVWQRSERNEDMAVGRAVEAATDVMKANNPFWLADR